MDCMWESPTCVTKLEDELKAYKCSAVSERVERGNTSFVDVCLGKGLFETDILISGVKR